MAEPVSQITVSPAPRKSGGLFVDGREALGDVRSHYGKWSEQLTERSFELSLAVIAANWAVFGMDGLLKNVPAKLSIGVVVIGLLLTLMGTWLIGEWLKERANYAEADPERWERECEETRGKVDPWPYTTRINRVSSGLRFLKTFAPILAGLLLVVALFRK